MKIIQQKPSAEQMNVLKKVTKQFAHAVSEYKMIEENDVIAVGLSGGKDSWTLLHLLLEFQRKTLLKFQIKVITVETGFPGFAPNVEKLKEYCSGILNIDLIILKDKFPEIIEKHKTPNTSACSFCARMRRGALYTYLEKEKINKLALGHHADDVIESSLMSQMYNGVLWSQAPVVKAKDKNITVIRPLIFIFEEQIKFLTDYFKFPIITCGCPYEGNENHKRFATKQLVKQLCQGNPSIRNSLLKSSQEVFQFMKIKRQNNQQNQNEEE